MSTDLFSSDAKKKFFLKQRDAFLLIEVEGSLTIEHLAPLENARLQSITGINRGIKVFSSLDKELEFIRKS